MIIYIILRKVTFNLPFQKFSNGIEREREESGRKRERKRKREEKERGRRKKKDVIPVQNRDSDTHI